MADLVLPAGLLGVFAALLGLVGGSFANVCIHRWPDGGAVSNPRRSRCPECHAQIQGRDNVPVMSWILLRGHCRDCGAPISVRYPVVEIFMAAAFVATTVVWGPSPALPAMLVLVWALVVASAIDLRWQIIPNVLTLRLPLVLLPLVVFAAVVAGTPTRLGAVAAYGLGVPLAMVVFSEVFRLVRGQAGIGMGDVKLVVSIAMVTGLLGGWFVVVFAYASVLIAVAVALGLLLAGRARLATRIPFGPYLAAGALCSLLVGPRLQAWIGPAFGF
ncbi:MAG: prepilin peptidase [Nitriliruptoraceae bacterium]